MKTPTHKGLACLLALTLATCAAFFTSGCASTGERTITKEDVITAAEIAAGLVIDNKDNVAEALKVVRDARAYIAEGEAISIDGLADYLITRAIQSQGVSAGQTQAIKSFFKRFSGNLTLELDKVGIDPEIVVTVGEVLDAVERVALEIDRFGAPLQRSYSTAQFRKPIDESLWGWITDKRTRERYPLTLAPKEHVKLDPKWEPGIRHMLANPEPMPEGL
jgi:hypothetical protein